MIARIRSHVESIGTKLRCQMILMNIARHMRSIHNVSRQVIAEQQFEEESRKIQQYFRESYESYEQLGMNGYSISARNYPQGYSCGKELQDSKLKGFLGQRRVFRNLLVKQQIIWNEGTLGQKVTRTQSQSQQNHLTRIEERSESRSKDRGVKDPNTTQWRRGPVRHTTMLVKVLQCLDSTSAKEC